VNFKGIVDSMTKTIGDMTVQEIFDAVDSGMAEVSRKLASGELDQSRRFYTDAELAAQIQSNSDDSELPTGLPQRSRLNKDIASD
jgi:hypothetical protein